MRHLATNAQLRRPEHSAVLDETRLQRHLSDIGMTLDRHQGVRQFVGGLANLNFLIHVDGAPVVLRRPPDGPLPPGAHDMAREHTILSRLWQALPLAPRSLHLCTDTRVLGVPFQLIEYRDGVVITGDDDSRLHGRAASVSHMLVKTLARIHAVDTEAVGLTVLGRPQGFVARAIAGWRKRGARLQPAGGLADLIEEIGQWLHSQPVRHRAPTLLHCDFKLDNLILCTNSLRPVAIVDWDMGTRGDPLFDLGTLLSYWSEAGDPPCMHELAQMPSSCPGFATRAQAMQMYARETGQDLSDFPTYRVLAMLKLGVVFLQLHDLYVQGQRSDQRYARFGPLGEDLLLLTRDIIHGRAE